MVKVKMEFHNDWDYSHSGVRIVIVLMHISNVHANIQKHFRMTGSVVYIALKC